MQRNIIETPAISAIVEASLAGLPEPLASWQSCLRPVLLRHAFVHGRAVIARRRKSDPQWAQRAFDRKERLFRMDDRALQRIASDFRCHMENLAEIALIAINCKHPMRQDADRFLRALRHWQLESSHDDLYGLTVGFLDRACRSWCRAHRHEQYADPEIVRQGALTGSRCRSLAEIMALGREAGNCLNRHHDIHMDCFERRCDIWSLRADDRLVAVLRVRIDPEPVAVELLGPRNRVGVSGYGHDLVQWFIAAGIKVGDDCHIRLADLMPKDMYRPQEHKAVEVDATMRMLFDI